EEDHLYEYLNLLVSRPDLAQALGSKAREWVARECSWEAVAKCYASFAESVIAGPVPTKEWQSRNARRERPKAAAAGSNTAEANAAETASIQVAGDSSAGDYVSG